LKLNDAQTHLIAGVEQVTSLYLLPKFSRDADSILHEVANLVGELCWATEDMRDGQSGYGEAGIRLRETANDFSRAGYHLGMILEELDAV